MKIKTILITACLVIGAGAATSYFVRKSNESNITMVEVVPVTSVNSAAYSFGDTGTVSGTVISRDTQVVQLDTSHELVGVYVQQGDRVKKGDKLLEYDMLGDELKEEMEELTKLGLELNLESMKRDLETLKSGRMPDSMSGDSDSSTDFSSGKEDDDDDSSGSDDSGSNSESRTKGGVQKQGKGAVGAADTLAARPLAGAYSKPASAAEYNTTGSSTTWSSDFLRNLQILQDELRKKASGLQGETLADDDDDDGETVEDTPSGDGLPGGDGLLPEEDGEQNEPPLTVQELFLQMEGNELDFTDEGASADLDGVPLITDEDGSSDAGTTPDGLFNEEGSTTLGNNPADAPALISSPKKDDEEGGGESGEESGEEGGEEGGEGETLTIMENPSGEEGILAAQEEIIETEDPAVPVVFDDAPELETNFEGTVLIDDDDGDDTDGEGTDIIADVNSFLSNVNAITLAVDSGWDAIGSQIDAINSNMDFFRNTFAEGNQYETIDLFGENVIVTSYTVSPEVRSQVGDATAQVMQDAYDRLCAFHFIWSVQSLNPTGMPSSSIDPTWATQNEQALRAVVSELASLPESMWIYNPSTGAFQFSDKYSALNNGVFSGEPMVDFLKGAVLEVNSNYVMEERTDIAPVVSTEGKMLGGGDSSDDGGDLGYSAAELAEAIKEQEKNIKETELQIREAELGIKEYKRILDGKIVYATMDGIVKSAGTLDSSAGNSFITITGKEGLYVKGSVNELSLDTVKVGDTITGTSYETGNSFTAQIVEISEYPETSNNSYYYGFGDENTNSSYYPFYAYIEDAEGLEVDSYVELSLSNNGSQGAGDAAFGGGLSLEEYFVRTDGNGRSYCYVQGKDGLLEKRYLEIGANNWGVITIKSGLTQSDKIAFPYGDGVEEGAQTVEVEFLTAVDGESY